MIALILAAQLAADLPANPRLLTFAGAPSVTSGELIRRLPGKSLCMANPGRIEASMAQPTALYRKGDRPAKGLRNWVDFPDGGLCLVEAGR